MLFISQLAKRRLDSTSSGSMQCQPLSAEDLIDEICDIIGIKFEPKVEATLPKTTDDKEINDICALAFAFRGYY